MAFFFLTMKLCKLLFLVGAICWAGTRKVCAALVRGNHCAFSLCYEGEFQNHSNLDPKVNREIANGRVELLL